MIPCSACGRLIERPEVHYPFTHQAAYLGELDGPGLPAAYCRWDWPTDWPGVIIALAILAAIAFGGAS